MIGVNHRRMELTFLNLFKKEQTTSLREVYWIVAATISQVLVLNQTALFFQCSSHEKPMCLCTSCHLKQTCLHLLWPSALEAGSFSPFPSLLSTPRHTHWVQSELWENSGESTKWIPSSTQVTDFNVSLLHLQSKSDSEYTRGFGLMALVTGAHTGDSFTVSFWVNSRMS